MRKPLILAAMAVVIGIGGTGHAAPFQPLTEGPLHADLIDRTPCANVIDADEAACRGLQRAIAEGRRTTAHAALASGWRGERLGAFARLVAAQDAFAHAVAANEIDHDVARDDASVAEGAEKDAFLRTLRALVHGHTVPRGGGSLEALDAGLNATYARGMAVRDTQELAWGSVDKAGIRRTERAWLAYRDAFVAFAATLDAPDAAKIVEAELTRRRAAGLEAFLED